MNRVKISIFTAIFIATAFTFTCSDDGGGGGDGNKEVDSSSSIDDAISSSSQPFSSSSQFPSSSSANSSSSNLSSSNENSSSSTSSSSSDISSSSSTTTAVQYYCAYFYWNICIPAAENSDCPNLHSEEPALPQATVTAELCRENGVMVTGSNGGDLFCADVLNVYAVSGANSFSCNCFSNPDIPANATAGKSEICGHSYVSGGNGNNTWDYSYEIRTRAWCNEKRCPVDR